MWRITNVLSLFTLASSECGTKPNRLPELPREPALHEATHSGQWRLVAVEGSDPKGDPITNPENGVVIRGHWAIGEIELYSDPDCRGDKMPTLEKDNTQVTSLLTTYQAPKSAPFPHESNSFLEEIETDGTPWYSELRALDECQHSWFWSECTRCAPEQAWFGVRFDDPETELRCLRIIQKDSDAYLATGVRLQRWLPEYWNSTTTEDGIISKVPMGSWSWHQIKYWNGLEGGRWFLLTANSSLAIAGAPPFARPGVASVITISSLLLWVLP